jgi:hypothetical protein
MNISAFEARAAGLPSKTFPSSPAHERESTIPQVVDMSWRRYDILVRG